MAIKITLLAAVSVLALAVLVGCARTPPTAPTIYDQIVIDTFAPNGGLTSDTFLTLIDADGNILDTDDDGNPDQINHTGYSRIDYTSGLPAGVYFIKVEKDTATGSMYYGVRVLDFDPGASFPLISLVAEGPDGDDATDGSGVPVNPVPIALGDGEAQSRTMDPNDTDDDWFKLVLP